MGVVFEARDENARAAGGAQGDLARSWPRTTTSAPGSLVRRRPRRLLDSPHVVQVYAHGEADGRLWIATQLVPDGDLAHDADAATAPRRCRSRST